ncbi:MAG TPA: sodium transporter, partial [Candidatus Dormibacteraeota bacterium]|nr:sodium transporter [Candidatus Dormibacteraeota bacterium]
MTLLGAGVLTGPDYFIVAGYFALMLGIGFYFYRFMKGLKDYFSGGNRIPWWLSGVSFYMTSFSAYAFIAYSALAYSYGWVGVTLLWISGAATMVSVTFFAKRWRRARIDSPVEYLEGRYSPAVRQLFAWHGVPVRVFDDALKLIATGTFLSVGLGLDMRTSMIVSGGIMLAYTLMGGLWAVAVTDFVQFIVLTCAIVILLPLAFIRAGGVGAVIHHSPPGFFHLVSPEYNWVYIGSNLVLASICFSSLHWPLVQRYYCVPTERDAQKVGWLVVVLYFIGPPLMILPAVA